MLTYFLILAPFLILGMWAQSRVTGTYAKWSEVAASSGQSGAQIARAILDRNGLMDVQVLHTPGQLTDHYDPRTRTVNLSDAVYARPSVAAVAVAAHEVGHAIQHQQAYAPLAIRSTLVPVAQIGSSAFMPLFILGIVLASMGAATGSAAVMLIAIIGFAMAVLFQLVTLPVEFDASRRAKIQLQQLSLAPAGNASPEAQGTQQVLSAAALTYVAAALASVAQLAYFAFQFLGSRN
ncbi:MAG: zinc metallopeptidase [Gaiellales bacterium]